MISCYTYRMKVWTSTRLGRMCSVAKLTITSMKWTVKDTKQLKVHGLNCPQRSLLFRWCVQTKKTVKWSKSSTFTTFFRRSILTASCSKIEDLFKRTNKKSTSNVRRSTTSKCVSKNTQTSTGLRSQ